MKRYFFIPIWVIVLYGCQGTINSNKSIFSYITPRYDSMGIGSTADTLHLSLNDSTYNDIRLVSTFAQSDTEYIYFHDRRSESVNVYNFRTREQVKRINLKKCFRGHKLYKTTVYIRNFDSILVCNKMDLYLMDSAGVIHKSFPFLEDPPLAWSFFENANPPVFKGNKLYTGVRPYVEETSLKALRQWKVLYEYDLNSKDAKLCYYLPEIYQEHLYGYHFLSYAYCSNPDGNFVFSFAADPNIYETDLKSEYKAYNGKSASQKDSIEPTTKRAISEDSGVKNYLTMDSYGPIYYDPFTERYLRVAKHRITAADFAAKKRTKKQSIILFDKHFKIIGESPVDENILLNSLFLTNEGEIYARVNVSDEYALHFVRLTYQGLHQGKVARNE